MRYSVLYFQARIASSETCGLLFLFLTVELYVVKQINMLHIQSLIYTLGKVLRFVAS